MRGGRVRVDAAGPRPRRPHPGATAPRSEHHPLELLLAHRPTPVRCHSGAQPALPTRPSALACPRGPLLRRRLAPSRRHRCAGHPPQTTPGRRPLEHPKPMACNPSVFRGPGLHRTRARRGRPRYGRKFTPRPTDRPWRPWNSLSRLRPDRVARRRPADGGRGGGEGNGIRWRTRTGASLLRAHHYRPRAARRRPAARSARAYFARHVMAGDVAFSSAEPVAPRRRPVLGHRAVRHRATPAA